jgi:hypothetical protein
LRQEIINLASSATTPESGKPRQSLNSGEISPVVEFGPVGTKTEQRPSGYSSVITPVIKVSLSYARTNTIDEKGNLFFARKLHDRFLFNLSLTLIERKSRMPHIQGVTGEAVV